MDRPPSTRSEAGTYLEAAMRGDPAQRSLRDFGKQAGEPLLVVDLDPVAVRLVGHVNPAGVMGKGQPVAPQDASVRWNRAPDFPFGAADRIAIAGLDEDGQLARRTTAAVRW